MNKRIKEYFDFNNKERIGVLTLLTILIILIIIYYSLPYLISQNPGTNNQKLKQQVQAFIEARKAEDNAQPKQSPGTYNSDKDENTELTPFPFDPNNLPVSQWKRIGFSEKQIQIIKNYEKSGGRFYEKEDLKIIYGISPEEYSQLEPYIQIKKQERSQKSPKDSKKNTPLKKEAEKTYHMDLNTADSGQLIKIKGIGKVFSSRIVKYRNYLGGFYKKEQLMEVYNFDSSNYQSVQKHFWVDSTKIQKVNLNTATFKELLHHPYLDYYLVKEIVNHRQEHGRYKTLSELKKLDLMYVKLYEKLKHYLTLS